MHLAAQLPPTAALLPLAVIAVGFVIFCLRDIVRAPEVRYLPKWGWALAVCLSVPLGGVVYLMVGRST